MPLFAKLVGSIATALVALFSQFLAFKTALKLAAYTAWIAIFTALLVSVFVCVSSIFAYVTATGGTGGTSWMTYFWMGVGMFIPANASAILACVASIWISTNIYLVQRRGLFGFAS